MINTNQPVLIYVYSPYLLCLHLPLDSHFGGHAIIVDDYDDEQVVFMVGDRDVHGFSIHIPNGFITQDYHLIPYEEMRQARLSAYRPFPVNNKYITFDLLPIKELTKR